MTSPRPKITSLSLLTITRLLVFLCLSLSGCSFFDSEVESFPASDTKSASGQEDEKEDASEEAEKSEDEEKEKPEFGQQDYLRRAENAYDRGLYSLARENWVKLRDEYPASPFESFAQLKIADTFFFGGDYSSAIPIYEEFLKLHPGHEGAPYARLQIANAFRKQYTGPAHDQSPIRQALINYERVLSEYPSSYFKQLAREGIAFCKTTAAEHEEYVADFYRRAGQEKATKGRMALVEKAASEKKEHRLTSGKSPENRLAMEVPRDPENSAIEQPARSKANVELFSADDTVTKGEHPGRIIETPGSVAQKHEVTGREGARTTTLRPGRDSTLDSLAPENSRNALPAVSRAELPGSKLPGSESSRTESSRIEVSPSVSQQAGPRAEKKAALNVPSGRAKGLLAAQSICKDFAKSSVVELPFSGKFELRVGERRGTRILAELIFSGEEEAEIFGKLKSFRTCESKRVSVVLGKIRESEEGFSRSVRLDFAPGTRYRVFPLNSPERLIAVSFEN